MNTINTWNMEAVELKARQERAEFIAALAKYAVDRLSKVFVSELRSTRAKVLARLQAA